MVEDVLLEHNLGIMPVPIELLVLLVQTLQVVSADVFNAAIAFADIGKECWDVPAKIHEQIGIGKPAYHELIERRLPCTDVSCNDQVHDSPLLPSTSRIWPF